MVNPLNTVIHGDCLHHIYTLDEHSVDLILVDPPYNIAKREKVTMIGGSMISNMNKWGSDFNDNRTPSDYLVFMEDLSSAYDYVLSDKGSLITFFDRSTPQILQPFYDKFTFRNMITFIKGNPIPHFRKNNYRSGFEQCAWFTREKYNINFISQKNMVNVFYGDNRQHVTDHPTEKPEWMISPLIERHSNKGDIVLDPMCGSGTTLVCSKKLDRNYIGIELEPKWVVVSQNRLKSTHHDPNFKHSFK